MNERTTILIAESDIDTAVPLLLHLQDHGFRTLRATDGGWALRLARAARPDLILLAADLPRVGGLTVCRTLRQESAVPILLLVPRRALNNGNGHASADRIVVGDVVLDRVTPPSPPLQGGQPPETGGRGVWRAGRPVRLHRREFDLLCVLMEKTDL